MLFAGCRDTDKKTVAISSGRVHESNPETGQMPYFEGLIEEYRTILAEDPDNLAGLIALGNAYFDSGRWREAIPLYERALAINPRNADVHTDVGTAYRNLKMPDRALMEYRRALKLDPGHEEAHYNMGIVYAYDLKDYAAAVHVWEELLRHSPNYPFADSIRSRVNTFKKKLKKDLF